MSTLKYISLSEFSKRTGIKHSTVQEAIQSGRIKTIKKSKSNRTTGINLKKGVKEYKDNTDPCQSLKNVKEKMTCKLHDSVDFNSPEVTYPSKIVRIREKVRGWVLLERNVSDTIYVL